MPKLTDDERMRLSSKKRRNYDAADERDREAAALVLRMRGEFGKFPVTDAKPKKSKAQKEKPKPEEG